MTMARPYHQKLAARARPFSLSLYLLLVVGLSWPLQFAFVFFAQTAFARYALSSAAMVMVGVATYLAGHHIFHDGFSRSGWQWGKLSHYGWVLGLAAVVWVVPTILELAFGLRTLPAGVSAFVITDILGAFLIHFVATLVPAFGEEFGWRGYLLRHLAERYSLRRALLFQGLIWWAWHLPTLIGMGLQETGGPVSGVAFTLLISLIPSILHAVIYAYIWTATQSLAVATVYHAAFDESRDAIEGAIGLSPMVQLWQMLVLTVLGALLLWKGHWDQLTQTAEAVPPVKSNRSPQGTKP